MECFSIGCLCIDTVVDRNGVTTERSFGGNAPYAAAGMRLWTSDAVGIVARAGKDFSEEWIDSLKKAGFDTRGIRHLPARHLMLSLLTYDESGERTDINTVTPEMIRQAESELEGIIENDVYRTGEDLYAPTRSDIPDSYKSATGITLCARKYERQMGYLDWIEEYAPHSKVVLDTSPRYMRPEYADKLTDLFKRADIVAPSFIEARSLFGENADPEECLRGLINLGAPNAVIKLGARGSCFMRASDMIPHFVPAFEVKEAKDPTGAGDSFCGGMTLGLLKTGDLLLAVMYGTVSASFVVEEFGVEGSFRYNIGDAEKRLRELTDKM
ncbi:MAG: carbohydrate kinase family protein [Oscillospiraceae bacterium]|nr:carbohydrate kinase family protein [Oscillospiraceae bacterium]